MLTDLPLIQIRLICTYIHYKFLVTSKPTEDLWRITDSNR